jgi:concanavalin A-like lectin/glucanase superfamily protein/F5/8 type C domain-containing protein
MSRRLPPVLFRSRARSLPLVAGVCLAMTVSLGLAGGPAFAGGQGATPAGINPGAPPWAGSAHPVPAPPASYDPSRSMLQAIYNADVAAGGRSYWFDRLLARPYLPAANDPTGSDSVLMTRGRALYMYTQNPAVLGFAAGGFGANGGGWAYQQPGSSGAPQNLYTISVSGGSLTENHAKRWQYPSYFSSVYARTGLSVAEKKFITYNDVAVTDLTLTDTGTSPTTVTLTAASPIAATASADGTELTGKVALRYGLSTIYPRMSGDGFTTSGTSLTRTVTLAPGTPVSLKVQLGAIAKELPGSLSDYQRYRGYSPMTAWLTQMREYNQYWIANVPYIDLPDKNVEKIFYYRYWENRFNSFDGNIPGNDYQFPVDLEGALGYNNQISLSTPMRMQDLQWWRDPSDSYGSWLSQGEESGCQAFHDNPGDTGNWDNTYEQWTGTQAWQDYLIHGGPKSIVRLLAKYAECDLEGTLAKFDTNHDNLIEYSSGTLPGNDGDPTAFKYYGTRPQDRTESSFQYSEATTAAQEFSYLGDRADAAKMNTIANNIRTAIMTKLWAPGPVTDSMPNSGQATGPRAQGKIGNAVKLAGTGDYVNLPAGIASGLSDFTISAWVNPATTTDWTRVFDFGTGTTAYMFLTVNAGSGPRFAITTSGGGGEQQLTSNTQLPLNTWSHLAVTLSGNTGTLYVNGTAVATNTNMTLHPSDLGNTTQDWIGRSEYGDPYLNATVDDFAIYNRALTASEIGVLAGGQAAAGNVADYKFDEASGATALDSSGNGQNATIISPKTPTITCPGKVFLQRDLTTNNLICWKDQQNFTPYIDGVPPDTPAYTQGLRYYGSAKDFPIFPIYTADQADQAAAMKCATCSHGTNNFSNINATLQARLYSKAIRDYPTSYITPAMYRQLIEWLGWNEDINGDNRFPDNNEYYYDWKPKTKTYVRSSINDDVLGSYSWMMFQDIAGLQPRADSTVELWPIDMGYGHFTVNNVSYHGADLTVVWQEPGGTRYYPAAPMGYSLYVNGRLAFNTDQLAHVTWNSQTGQTTVLGGSSARVLFHTRAPLVPADQVDLSGNPRMVGMLQEAGDDISGRRAQAPDLAEGKTATASFTTTAPAAQATSPGNAVDGYTISGLPVVSGSYTGTNPIWGDLGSPNAQDWLQVNLGKPTRFDDVKVYFYSNKEFGFEGGTYRQPASYTIQYFNGSSWVDVPGQAHSPRAPAPNYNQITFAPVHTRMVRILVTPMTGYAVGIKELQVFGR